MRGAPAGDGLSGSLDAARVVRFANFVSACVMFDISPRFLPGTRQSFDTGGVFGAPWAFFQHSGNLVFVTRKQRADVEP